jgi:hypothetical protein
MGVYKGYYWIIIPFSCNTITKGESHVEKESIKGRVSIAIGVFAFVLRELIFEMEATS